MSEPKLISPMLDNFIMGDSMSDHHGVRCYPAIENETNNRYIVKVISVPATPSQLDALLLSGAYSDRASALDYFKKLADDVLGEVDTLEKLSELEGFVAYAGCQMVPMTSGEGYDIYLLSSYKRTLQKHFKRHSFTHLDALNLGLDLCAALSVCRRSGYMYVDLKPSNVFVTDQRLYRIGDLGFIRMDSLKYASIPEKYLSQYSPPEVSDALSALNATMDTYAAGLILYQTYNNGELPFNSEIQPGDKLPAPLYADYEMSEIILKACAPDPNDRWQDPMQMGQAIISYMQRNGAEDTPIVPMPTPEIEDEASSEPLQEDIPQTDPPEMSVTEDEVLTDDAEISDKPDASEEASPEEMENLSFFDETPYEDEIPADYTAITDEVTEMLEQADELASMDVPEPVVVPDHVDVPIPELPEPDETAEITEEEIDSETDDDSVPENTDIDSEAVSHTGDEEQESSSEKRQHHWLRNGLLILVIVALLAGGIYFYKHHYLLPIEFIALEGSEDSLTVFVTTDIDESLLQVICSDTYGNQIPAPVVNGKAEFTGLIPNTAYNIRVIANGFHRLTGNASTAYSTPIQTKIVQFDAVTGATEDSVILSFTIEGPDCKQWTVIYTADGEEERSATFASHMVTLTNLAVGKDYTFRLVPSEELYVTGFDEIVFTTRKLIKAENVEVVSCIENALTVQWRAPEGETVSGWSVCCKNETYNQTIITTENTVTFQDLDHTAEYTIEVKAVGMSVSQTATVPANSITASNFRADTSDPTKLTFTWEPSRDIPDDGWLLRYSVVGIESEVTIPCNANTAVITPIVPNATYKVQLEDSNGNILLGSKTEITTAAPVDFSKEFASFQAQRSDLEFSMCRAPEREGWGRYDLSNDDYTSAFTVGENMAFLVRFQKLYNAPAEEVTVQYVMRNQAGTPIQHATELKTWKTMWSTSYCKLSVPVMPVAAGSYTVEVYFNGELAHTQEFTLT